ncbi:DUF4185 domain-containing protein [Mycobacterium sp. PS03-16]|uniref:DUF4185 domain-containing protein n=1 Tax=Mycobacterium sp. PS03-16 TaxID=2559611 RepID=UPI0010738258|nr:DUF4185 domain-containing protein [Mycobacterium sp. PS03-16]TFV55449.1 DUF4185 domain-containing protein [Mycobacterium sp. PS03-16]
MNSSAYVGRVGGLAVALGVGAAVVLGTAGPAWAESPDGEPSSQTAPAGTEPAEREPDSPTADEEAADEQTAGEQAEADSAAAADVDETDVSLDEAADDLETTVPAGDPAADLEETDEAPVEETVVDPEGGSPALTGTDPEPAAAAAGRDGRRAVTEQPAETEVPAEREVSDGLRTTAVDPDPEVVAEPPAVFTRTVENISAPIESLIAQTAPVVTAMTAPTAARSATPVLNRLLAAFGLGGLRNLPSLPTPAWGLGALLALASRREVERAVTTRSDVTGSPVAMALAAATPADPAKDYQVTPVAVSTNTVRITNVTGPGGLNDTTSRFGIGGTDLGIMWDNGIPDNPATAVNEHQVLIAFGDTFSNRTPVRTGIWRMNTLFRSTDTTLNNGMYVADGIVHDPGMYSGSPMSDPDFSREIIGNYHYGVGPEVTMIPTAAISVPGAGKDGATRQYINYMAVRSWDTPGRWTTNYSAIAYSDDNGQNWTVVPASSVRPAAAGRSTLPFVNGDQNFQQGAYVRKYTVDPVTGKPLKDAAGREITDGYIYSYGTPAGRGGTAYLSRVAEADILDKTKYQYWNGSSWVAGNPAAAKPILPSSTKTSFFGLVRTTTYPTVSEMSVQYNAYEKKYVMLYGDANNNIVMRKADRPEGPWSAPVTLVTASKMPGLYAPMIHPWSSTDNVSAEDQKYLYWNLSTWDDYQVKLMRTDLSKV